jgi:hypothetical protein
LPDGQRGEVSSLIQRRRRWTTEQKLALVKEDDAAGLVGSGRHGPPQYLPKPPFRLAAALVLPSGAAPHRSWRQ